MLAVGVATYVCGFFVPALLNLYLVAIAHPLVETLRATLSYQSAIVGDGLVLPVVNMVAAATIAKQRSQLGRGTILSALLMGAAIMAVFHVNQAVHGIVNWAMPSPWRWNALGFGHALYMLSVTSWLSLFLVVVLRTVYRERALPAGAAIVLLGVAVFFVLLRLDYL